MTTHLAQHNGDDYRWVKIKKDNQQEDSAHKKKKERKEN